MTWTFEREGNFSQPYPPKLDLLDRVRRASRRPLSLVASLGLAALYTFANPSAVISAEGDPECVGYIYGTYIEVNSNNEPVPGNNNLLFLPIINNATKDTTVSLYVHPGPNPNPESGWVLIRRRAAPNSIMPPWFYEGILPPGKHVIGMEVWNRGFRVDGPPHWSCLGQLDLPSIPPPKSPIQNDN